MASDAATGTGEDEVEAVRAVETDPSKRYIRVRACV